MATTAPRPTPPAANLLRLFLSVATESKVISKQQQGGGAFRCRTCGRAFATFQALGGHRTSHKRPRVRAHGLDLLLGARPGGKGAAAGHDDVHRCNTCGLVFSTGQALGGHMRRHRPAAAATIKFVALSSSQEGHDDDSEDDDDDTGHTATLFKFI
ncbi:hypothetical protein BS78_05G282500 [Paspalum vaginatum]|nr:hypothetical protein BS78_05G282500 [Paspalum vaginatum]